ncbi:unnamed protein product [Cochlearia groenlandica]
MAPNKKLKSVNKRFNNEAKPRVLVVFTMVFSVMVEEVSAVNELKLGNRKKRLIDKLGPQWTSRELERFYDAYRKHRGDWKKVAASVRNNRSVDMVESLFHMNRAYLSLPEGVASVAGLIAMMTDHYNVIEGSESEGEGHDVSEVPRKHQKHKHIDFREKVVPSHSIASEEGCLPFLRQTQVHGKERRAARKRTPRFQVQSTYDTDYREGYTLLNKRAKIHREDDDSDSYRGTKLNGRTVIRLGKRTQAKETQSRHYDANVFESGVRTSRDKRHIKEAEEVNDSDDSGEPRDFFDDLQALSELAASMVSGSFAHSNEDRKPNNEDEKSNTPEAIPSIHHIEKAKPKSDGETVSIVELHTSRRKRKQKESMAEDDTLKTPMKARINNGQGGPVKQPIIAKISEESCLTIDEKKTKQEEATQVSGSGPEILQRKPINRRKMSLKKNLQERAKSTLDKKLHCNEVFSECDSLQDKVSTCLSYPSIRRWCIYEWFYSAIDYPWFAKMELSDYLNHVGLGHVPRLTRLEWSVIKSSLGRPRRFSERYIEEERAKLNQYRESVRNHYMELREGARESLPTDLAQPLSVGNRVIAIHPKTREIRDGKILAVDRDKCKVLFDEVGVDSVMDIDCMPLNPLEYMPEYLRRQIDKCLSVSKETQLNRHLNFDTSLLSPPTSLENVDFSKNPSAKQELDEEMIEIFSGSKSKAQAMIDAIMKAASSSSVKKDEMVKQGLTSNGEQLELNNGISLDHQSRKMSNGFISHERPSKNKTQTPSELITSCAAIWLMIQMCTEKQYPPADVAQLMDKAMRELQPRCAQNMTLYREIQTCMGLIKTQIMSLVRT